MKAAESIHIYRRFLDCPDTKELKTRFILVINDSAKDIGETLEGHARSKDNGDMYTPKFLLKYKIRDRSGSALFYDQALISGTVKFKHMMEKTKIVVPVQPQASDDAEPEV